MNNQIRVSLTKLRMNILITLTTECIKYTLSVNILYLDVLSTVEYTPICTLLGNTNEKRERKSVIRHVYFAAKIPEQKCKSTFL